MPIATLTSKGQVTIPKEVRGHLSLKSGDRLDFIIQSDGQVVLRPATVDVRSLRGILMPPARPISVAEMNAVIRSRRGGRR